MTPESVFLQMFNCTTSARQCSRFLHKDVRECTGCHLNISTEWTHLFCGSYCM